MLDNAKDSNYIWKTKLSDLKNIVGFWVLFMSWLQKQMSVFQK